MSVLIRLSVLLPLAGLSMAGLSLSGCSVIEPPAQVRGNKVDEEVLRELVPGTSRRADVSALLGTPSATSTFSDDQWYYISEVTRPRVARVQRVEEQQVIVLTFDREGILRDIKKLTEEDGQNVGAVSRTTPVPGHDPTILQQLLGNVGRFTPSAGSPGRSGTTGGRL